MKHARIRYTFGAHTLTAERPHFQLSTQQLSELAAAGGQKSLKAVIHELGFRSGKAARRLLDHLNGVTVESKPAAKAQKSGGSDHPTKAAGRASSLPKFAPTAEQTVAIDYFKTGKHLKIAAFAGSGKTSTLQFLAHTNQNRGLYLAFNKSIAEEAKEKFPFHVDCRTTHSIAVRYVRGLADYAGSKFFTSINANQLAQMLVLNDLAVDRHIVLTGPQQAHLLLRAIKRFCNSADDQIEEKHVELTGKLLASGSATQAQMIEWIVERGRALWQRMVEPSDAIPMGHDGYLKVWSLNRPVLSYEFIFLDEAQDTNPAVLSVLTNQRDAQMVYVGDRHQQIYEWRGAINAMNEIVTPYEATLSQSFRFGGAIADAATQVLRLLKEPTPLRGFDQIHSEIVHGETTRAILARSNATVISETLNALSNDRKPHIVGGTTELREMLKDVQRLIDDQPGQRPEFFGFKNWQEVVAFSETDEGEALRQFVTLVQASGTGRLWAAILKSSEAEDDADVIISTTHKAKGREWDSVRIAEDFASCKSDNHDIPDADARLFYVAITRAKKRLCIDPILLRAYCSGSIAELSKVQRPS